MLRRVENVDVWYIGGFWAAIRGSSHLRLNIGAKSYTTIQRWTKNEFAEAIARSDQHPVAFMSIGERSYWLFQDRWHWDNEDLSSEEIYALLVTRDGRRRDSIKRAQSMVAMATKPSVAVRGAIPADVKQLVWKRDRGACRECGSQVELQYDHIIPFSMGGATVEDNLQILCGPCNRRKGASVA